MSRWFVPTLTIANVAFFVGVATFAARGELGPMFACLIAQNLCLLGVTYREAFL